MQNISDQVKKFFTELSSKISRPRMSTKEQMFFVKRLSFLIQANVPMLESLEMIHEQSRSKQQKKILDTLIHDVSNGLSLSTSMGTYNGLFGEFAMNIISVGEQSGILSQNLQYLADDLKKKQLLRRKVIGAFVYPAVVTVATLGITSFLMIYLFPKIMPVFTSLRMKLPLSTRIVIATSNTLRHSGLLILASLILAVIIFLFIKNKSKLFRFQVDRSLLKIPVIGTVIQYYNLANFSRTTGLLLSSGLTISEAMPIATQTSTHLVYRKEFENIASTVIRGEKISVQLAHKRSLFPDVLVQIIAVGERSGNLSNSLLYLSDLYEGEMDEFTKNLGNLVEPVLMIFMGLLIGFIAISIITPIYGITQNLHP